MNDADRNFKSTPFMRLAALVLLTAAVFIVYFRTIDNKFIWDDTFLISQNPFIQDTRNIPKLLTREYFSQKIEISYRPVNTLSFMLDYRIWKESPAGYHIENLLIHILCALFVFAIVLRLATNFPVALGGALLFALHPIQSEALNAVTFREDPLCLLFMLSSFYLYMLQRNSNRGRFICTAGSLLLFFLALFTKETAVVLPGMILAYGLFAANPPDRKRTVTDTVLFMVPTLFYLFVRFGPMKGPESYAYHGGSVTATFLLSIQALARYVALTAWPAQLCIDHWFPAKTSLTDPQTLASVFTLIGITAFAVVAGVKNRVAAFGAAWFALALLPVSNIIPIGVVMAERYLYIAMPGAVILIAVLLSQIIKDSPQRNRARINAVVCVLLAAAVLAAGFFTFKRNLVWENEVSFWNEACDCSPASAYAHVNLGVALMNSNMLPEAEKALVSAVRLSSDNELKDERYGTLYRAFTNLGIINARQSNFARAAGLLELSIKLNPQSPFSYWNLGVVYLKTGQPVIAERYLLRGLELDPRNVPARLYLISIYHRFGRLDDALEQCDLILKHEPGNLRAKKLKQVFTEQKNAVR